MSPQGSLHAAAKRGRALRAAVSQHNAAAASALRWLPLPARGLPYPAVPALSQHASCQEPRDQLCLCGGDTFLF